MRDTMTTMIVSWHSDVLMQLRSARVAISLQSVLESPNSDRDGASPVPDVDSIVGYIPDVMYRLAKRY